MFSIFSTKVMNSNSGYKRPSASHRPPSFDCKLLQDEVIHQLRRLRRRRRLRPPRISHRCSGSTLNDFFFYFAASHSAKGQVVTKLYFANSCKNNDPSFTQNTKLNTDCTKSDREIAIFLSLHLILCNRTNLGYFM